jgi:hypothetical protein
MRRNNWEGAVGISINMFWNGKLEEITPFWDTLGGVYVLVLKISFQLSEIKIFSVH